MSVEIGTLIERTPGVVGGRPRIAGTRISVDHIARCWKQGYTPDELVNDMYPHLTLEGVYATLAYYFANRDEIEASLAEELAFFEQYAADQ
ncbi:MAG: DUF433 domain-containing protein [Dehalococcoidia bacterium]|nr:DUF433 domain-containing protein [Dehalococcoidia bacterium]